jgi:hypothetical protein
MRGEIERVKRGRGNVLWHPFGEIGPWSVLILWTMTYRDKSQAKGKEIIVMRSHWRAVTTVY